MRTLFFFKEDYYDPDIAMYGNSPKGSNTITDADDRWLPVHVESPKIKRDVLIRMEALDGITVVDKL